jgi:tRNA threonylcarbamoyladenosine biosynthesis protein TsaE
MITSPTYTIISQYEGSVPFYHIDAYRLEGDEDFSALGAEELLYGEGVSVIEWSERIPRSVPPGAVCIELELLEGETRNIHILSPQIPLDLDDPSDLNDPPNLNNPLDLGNYEHPGD